LPAGSDTDEDIRGAILASKTVIGIVTPASRESTYVLIELGARWGTRKHLVPVLAGGIGPGELGGPVRNLNALDLGSRPNIHQLIGDLGTELKIEPERPEVFEEHIGRVIRASRAAAHPRRRRRTR